MYQNRLQFIILNSDEAESDMLSSKIAEIKLYQRLRRVYEKKQRIEERVEKYNSLNANSETDAARNALLYALKKAEPSSLDQMQPLCEDDDQLTNSKPSASVQPNTITEFLWEVNFNSFCRKEIDTAIFFFAGLLWKVTFGLNRSDPDYYYCIVAPAQRLERECRITCEFKILSEGRDMDFVKCHNIDYLFSATAEEVMSKGYSKFIHKNELPAYLRKHGSGMCLHLCIVLTTSVGPNGQIVLH